MRTSDLKYLAAYIIPVLVVWGIANGGLSSYAAVIFAFVIVPIFEPFFKASEENLSPEEAESKASSLIFDALLYLNLPIVFFLVFYLGHNIYTGSFNAFELTGLVLSMGTLLSSAGINVAHELGHKNSRLSKISAVILLTPSFYNHFFIEHNHGHHKNVGTPQDPASARINENLYAFWRRSVIGSWINAWKIEKKRLESNGQSPLSSLNLMIIFLIMQFIYSAILLLNFNLQVFLALLLSGIVSFLFLETINYVEHYGLRRKKLESGRYERVQPWHSWNSNHHLGRIILYELTRHSDHHFLAHKKYQLLDHHDKSPQLPFGYPTSMLISMLPPLWFRIMNKRIESHKILQD